MVALTSVLAAIVLGLVVVMLFTMLAPSKYRLPPGPRGLPWFGHAFQFGANPVKLMKDAYTKYGSVVSLKVLGKTIILLCGTEAHQFFYDASEDEFSAGEAYKFTVPVFGEGVVYDGPPENLVQQRKFVGDALHLKRYRLYVGMMEQECIDYFDQKWGSKGTTELMSSLSELTVLTSTRCLQGQEIRETMSAEFSELFFELDAGLSPIGFFYPNLPLPGMRARDRARARMDEIFNGIIDARRKNPNSSELHQDVVQTLMECRYEDSDETLPNDHIVGLMVALLLAGQHTSNVTATWLGSHLVSDPALLARVLEEQRQVGEGPLDYNKLASMKVLDACIKETLRMHPPIVLMMRKVLQDMEHNGYDIPAGSLVAVSPALAHRLDAVFPNPDVFDIDRFLVRNEGRKTKYSYMAFGASRHACIGEKFAYLQIKTVWSYLLRNYEIKLDGEFPSPNYTTLIIGPKPPVNVSFKRRDLFAQ